MTQAPRGGLAALAAAVFGGYAPRSERVILAGTTFSLGDVELFRGREPPVGAGPLDTPEAIATFCRSGGLHAGVREELWAILCDGLKRPLAVYPASAGAETMTVLPIRQIAQAAILTKAKRVILVHNHPSGNLRPSIEDEQSGEAVAKLLALLGIYLDSYIVTRDAAKAASVWPDGAPSCKPV